MPAAALQFVPAIPDIARLVRAHRELRCPGKRLPKARQSLGTMAFRHGSREFIRPLPQESLRLVVIVFCESGLKEMLPSVLIRLCQPINMAVVRGAAAHAAGFRRSGVHRSGV